MTAILLIQVNALRRQTDYNHSSGPSESDCPCAAVAVPTPWSEPVPNITTDAAPFIVAVWAVVTIAFLVVWMLHQQKRQLPKQVTRIVPYRRTRFVPFPRKSAEQTAIRHA